MYEIHCFSRPFKVLLDAYYIKKLDDKVALDAPVRNYKTSGFDTLYMSNGNLLYYLQLKHLPDYAMQRVLCWAAG